MRLASRYAAALATVLLVIYHVQPSNAEATDATKSESSGSGLQFATAGVLAQFTITAKDESGVRRTSGGDEWIVELDGTRSLTGSVVDNLDGTYQVSYTATQSGSYEANVLLAKSGGLTGSYFENVWFFYTPVKVTVDPQINMDWGTGLITPTGANYISARWVGKVKTQYAETYTFYATTDDGARLWVDNVPLIDRWDSYCNETSATIALQANVFYDFKMEYKQITGSAFAKLSWASQSTPKEIVPSSQLYYETQAKKSPFSFIVVPNVANGSQSTAAGTGLAVATAGTGAQFTIQANDMYANERGDGGDIFSVRIFPPGSIESGLDGRSMQGVVVDNTDSSYSVEYTTYKSGKSTLYAALLVRGGVTATYYDYPDFTSPVKYAEGTTNLQNVQFEPYAASDNDLSIPTINEFSVRYAGFVAPTKDSTYSFLWNRGQVGAKDRVRIWIDNSLIIDQWVSLSATNPSGNIDLRSAYYYDVRVDYKYQDSCATGSCNAMADLRWTPSGGTMGTILSTNLYRGYNVMDSPFKVDVQPASTCAAKSIAVPNQAGAGHSLELSTAGLQAEFTITAKDIYGNLRLGGGDNFKVRLTGVDSTSGLVQDLATSSTSNPGAYRVVYTATKSGTYDISVVFGASGVNQSPFRMVCQPARRHLPRSVPTGQALTLSTAGIKSSVTITIKDRHDNWQPDPSVVDAAVQFNIIDASTLQPTFLAQDSLTPDDIPNFVDAVSYIGPSTNAGKQVATPTDLDDPRLVLRYTVTRSGVYSLAVGGSKANDGPVLGSPFALTMFPNVACSSTSTTVGASLTLATAGVPGSFTVFARDQYFNLRGSNVGDNFVARIRQYYSNSGLSASSDTNNNVVECGRPGSNCQNWNTYNWGWTTVGGRDKPAQVRDNGDGTYVFSFNATRSTTNYIWSTYAVAGGLQATYYVGATTQPSFNPTAAAGPTGVYVQQDQTVDFSITVSTTAPLNNVGWTARWTGMVRPSLTETYTFYAGGAQNPAQNVVSNKAERVKLWVDNSLIIQQWTSLSQPAAASGKIALQRDQYYEILLVGSAKTADTALTSLFQLQWSSNNHAKSVISSSRLYMSYHTSGSPFVLNVVPAKACGATSRVYRPALTLTTAGVLASFTVQSKDAFDNLRTIQLEDSSAWGFSIVANASLPVDDSNQNRVQPSETNGGVALYRTQVAYIGSGGYQINYTATAFGSYALRGDVMQSGGLFGTYFENDDLTDHGTDTLGVATISSSFSRVDAAINFDWSGIRPVPSPSMSFLKDIGPNYFSVRWQGMVRPLFSEVYTFHAKVDDGAKLWINGLLVIDQWYSRCSEVDGTIALMSGTLYPIKIEYKQVVGNATMQLRWSSRSQSKDVVSSNSLYSNATTFNLCNRNMTVAVEPAVVCSSKSEASGSGLTIATAGKPARFTIQSRDEYMNDRRLSDSGIRTGSAGYFCDDWAHSGPCDPTQSASTSSVTIFLDQATASTVHDYYTGRTLTITAGTGAGQSRIVQDYIGGQGTNTKQATVYPPFSVIPDATSKYSIGNYGGQFSETCDSTRTQAFRLGFPEFDVRVTPVIEGSQAPYHASGIVDRQLVRGTALPGDPGSQYQGSGITRLGSTQYPGGLTATYYDAQGTDLETEVTYNPGFSSPVFSTRCTTALECDQTIDFSHAATTSTLKLSYGEFPEAIGSLGAIAGPLAATYYDHPSQGWELDYRLADSNYGVRWSGLIAPTLTGTYTFYAQFSDPLDTQLDDRVKLWIDNSLVIQQWNSLGTVTPAGTFAFAAAYPSAHSISIHYKNSNINAGLTGAGTASAGGLTLRWENMATGTTVTATNAFSTTLNSPCGTGGTDSTNQIVKLQNLCLATLNSASPYAVKFQSSFGSASQVDGYYTGQVISTVTPPTTTALFTRETRFVQDYAGVQTGTSPKLGTIATGNAGAGTIYLDVDASLDANAYTGMWLQVTSGTGVGQYALITASKGCHNKVDNANSGCDPRTTYCDCSGASTRSADFSNGWYCATANCTSAVATDATSKYTIYQYRAWTGASNALTKKTSTTAFTISTGYTLVTYGKADCAEFTGVALSGGNTTTTLNNLLTSTGSIVVFDANSPFGLFGQAGPGTIASAKLYIAIGASQNIEVDGVTAATNTLTFTAGTIAAAVTCTPTVLCTVTPRSTIVLGPGSNTADNYYGSGSYYIQVISGTCAGQWRVVKYSLFNNYFVTAAVGAPWSITSTKKFLGCVLPDSSSVYYLSKACSHTQMTLQTVGPKSSLMVKPGVDGEAIFESSQIHQQGTSSTVWNPTFYGQLSTQGDSYPYPYQPYDYSCCAAMSGNTSSQYYSNMIVVITSGTGRGQRRFITAYNGPKLQIDVTPKFDIIPDSTSRYAIYKSKMHRTVPSGTPFDPSTPGAIVGLTGGYNAIPVPAPVVPSSRLFPLRSRYEVTYTPTVKGDYQIHATLAQGSGLDATYYDDMELTVPTATQVEPGINFDIAQYQRGVGNDVPRSLGALALSDVQTFSVRWAGLLQLFDDQWDTTFSVFTFEAGIAETDERVKLWVDNSLIIDRWETYDYLSATTFSATIGLRNPYYYDLKMEYKQFAGSGAQAVLRWQCGITGSPCVTKTIIPSSNLFLAREISSSPFPPHEVQPAPTCAARSTVRGIPLSLATAGVMDSFTIQANDEYDNERGFGGDTFVVRAVPYNSWNMMEPYAASRSSADCIGCPRTVYGQVQDLGDSSYQASFNGTKKGAYKVLTSLALQGGLFATYYQGAAAPVSVFTRAGQIADSENDFPTPCIWRSEFRTAQAGANYLSFDATPSPKWTGFVGPAHGRWLATPQCQNWISGVAQNGYCSIDSNILSAFAQCRKVNGVAEAVPTGTYTDSSFKLDVTGIAAGQPQNYFIGHIVQMVSGTNVGQWRYITAYSVTGTPTATVTVSPAFTSAVAQSVTYNIYRCGTQPAITTEGSCNYLTTTLQPLKWWTSTSTTIVLDKLTSNIDDAYLNWDVKIVKGTCKGQIRTIKGYNALLRVATVTPAWQPSDGTTTDTYGATSPYSGCLAPDNTSAYILYTETLPPGSMVSATGLFSVRWAGFVKPSSTTEYTFQTLLSGTADVPNRERVKLWVDDTLLIDQWGSLSSTRPSGTIAFPSAGNALYDIQVEYKRVALPTAGQNLGDQTISSTYYGGYNHPPRISLRWKNEKSGSDASLSEAYDYKVISTARLFTNYPIPNSRVLDLQVAPTSPGACVATGDGLSTATAGYQATFTITAKDAFANDRELEEDSFVVTVLGPNGFRVNPYPAPSPNTPGTYQVAYVATVSGNYDITVRRANAGGLLGEYFNNMWLLGDPAITSIDPTVPYNWGSASIAPSTSVAGATPVTGSDYMSVRWSGLFKPELSEVYTFYAAVDNGARLYVDTLLSVDQWDTATGGEYNATLAATAGLLYDLKLEYRHVTGNASAVLSYSSLSISKTTIPSSRLFNTPQHVFGSPFRTYISPTVTCGSTSQVSGPGLSYSTAARYAYFTIQARDEYLNTRTKWEDTFVVKTAQSAALTRGKAGTVSANVVKGRYNVAYLVTQAGPMGVYASLAVTGGIMATYYDAVAATFYSASTGDYYADYGLPAKSRVDANVYMNNYYSTYGGLSCECTVNGVSSGTADAGGSCSCNATSLVQDQVFAARWSGLIRPCTASLYTFKTVSVKQTDNQDRVRLWLDNNLVIDQWTSLTTATDTITVTYAFPVAMDYYQIELQYRTLAAKYALNLYDASTAPTVKLVIEQVDDLVAASFKPVGSANLAVASQVQGSPYNVTVMPDVTDFAVSTMVGQALTISSAGVLSAFTIQAKDTSGNLRTTGGDQFLVHVAAVGGMATDGVVQDFNNGTYVATYMPTAQGVYDIRVYMGSSDKFTTLFVQPGAACAATSLVNGLGLTVSTGGFAATFTIQAKDAFKNLRTLGTNEFFARLIGPGTEAHNNPATYIGVSPASNLGRFSIAYRPTRSGNFSIDVKLASTNGLNCTYFRDPGLVNAVKTVVDPRVDHNWGTDTPDASVGITDGFSIRWSGYLKSPDYGIYTFYTALSGTDERVKLWVDDQWVIDQWSSLGTAGTAPTGTLYMVKNSLYDIRVEYKDVMGSSEIHLAMEGPSYTKAVVPSGNLFSVASSVAGSPFMATVFPALTSGTVSTAKGTGLSIATAGIPAVFTIQAKDQLGNLKTNSDDVFVVRARHNADYTRRNIIGTVTPLATGAGKYAVSYTPTWKRNSLSCARAVPGLTSCGSLIVDFDGTGSDALVQGGTNLRPIYGQLPNMVANKHKYHDVLVSQAVKGGLQATYYSAVNTETTRTASAPALFPSASAYRAKVVPTVSQTFSSAVSGSLDAIDNSFGLRYTGFFSPPTSGYTYTLTAGLGGALTLAFERVRLWMDNSLIVDQWTSLSSTRPSGTLAFDTANGLYDIKIEYKQDGGVNAAAQLQLQYSYASQAEIVIPSTRLYQSYDLSFNIFDQTGLTATYYDSLPSGETQWVSGYQTTAGTAAGLPRKAVQESTVDWSGPTTTDRPYPDSLADGMFSVRWTGFIQPSRTDEYTFYVPLNPAMVRTTGERVQLWVDNTQVIAQWGSLASLEPSGTISFPSAGDYYNVVLDYMVTSTDVTRGLQLKWENQGQALAEYNISAVAASDVVTKGLVRPDRLFQIRTSSVVERDDRQTWDMDYFQAGVATLENRQAGTPGRWMRTNGCPDYVSGTVPGGTNTRESRCRGLGTRTNDVLRVDVRPAAVCAAKSTVSDTVGSLSLTTAGVTRTFTLTARDAYDNQRDATDDSFIARATLIGAKDTDVPFSSVFTHQPWSVLYAQGELTNPMWDVNGKYEAAYVMTRSGIYTHTIQSADAGGNGLYGTYFASSNLMGYAATQVDASVNFDWGKGAPTADPGVPAGNFSVRWSGYFKATFTEVYTFYTNCDGGVRLQVNRASLVNNWTSPAQEYAGTASLVGNVLYDIDLQYQSGGAAAFCSLWCSSPSTPKQIVNSSALFVEAETISGGDLQISSLPAIVSGTVSKITGPGLSIATAGIRASFTVMSMDMYGNLRDNCNDMMFVRMFPDPPPCPVGNFPYDWSGNSGNGTLGTFLTCSSVGKIRLQTVDSTSMMDEVTTNTNHGNIYPTLGLSSTYYGLTKVVPLDNTTGQACTNTRYSGNINPFVYVQTRAGSHTLYASELPGGRGKSYGGATQAVGTGLMATYYETSSFGTPRNSYDCILPGSQYYTAKCDTSNMDWSTSDMLTPGSLMADGIFSARWTGLIRSPVASAVTFQAVLGANGYQDERVKLWIDNSLLIDQWSSLATQVLPSNIIEATYVPTLILDQLYDIKVEYKNVVGGATDGSKLTMRWNYANNGFATIPSGKLYPAHALGGQALRVRVNPNVAFARECEVHGQGLTVATAGLQATFAIQAKDAYNNIRGTGGDLFIVRAFSDGCQVLSNSLDTKSTCQPYGPAIATCGLASDSVCPSSRNPAPELNDGGDDDGLNSATLGGAGENGRSRKVGGQFRPDVGPSLCVNCPRIIRADVVDNGDSTYTASFTGTQKGRYTVVTSLVNAGGLTATYYDNTPVSSGNYDFSTSAVEFRVDSTVDWSATTTTSMPSATLSQDGIFGVRWVGFVRPSRSTQYTFHIPLKTGGLTERVKLWVDNSIVIQQWNSIASATPSGTIGFATGNGYYDISMVYQGTAAALNGYQLLWENTASGVPNDDVSRGRIPSTRLFQRYDVPNTGLTCSGTPCTTKDYSSPSMHTTLQIMPSLTCASQSTAYDRIPGFQVSYGLTLATAGQAATFTIQAKDAYENTREDTSASFTVDLFGSGGSPIYNGAVTPLSSSAGTYTATFTAVNAKNYDVFVKYGSNNLKGAPYNLVVQPYTTCGTKSTIQGTGLTAASISPSKSAFTIQSRDQYGNARTLAGDTFVVRVARTSGTGMQGTGGLPPFYSKTAISSSPTIHSVFNTATNDGKYAGYYQIPSTPSPAGLTHYSYASLVSAGGVYATYYTVETMPSDSAAAVLSSPVDTVTSNAASAKGTFGIPFAKGFSAAARVTKRDASGPWGATGISNGTGNFVIRWNGLYTPSQTQMYFAWTGTSIKDRVRLWVDNKLIIDQWTSLAADPATTAPTGGYLFDSVSGVFDIHAEFLRGGETNGFDLEVKEGTLSGTIGTSIVTTRLFTVENLSGSPYAVTVST